MSTHPEPSDTPTILLVDIGNTNLKWTWLQGNQISAVESGAYRPEGVAVLADYSWSHVERPDRVVVANVAGQQVADELEHWIRTTWGMEPEYIRSTAQELGIQNAYRNPEQLGVDRWLALIAARKKTLEAVCVVDCGTAITIDLLSAEGRHQGGLILPGLAMMYEALLDRTQITHVEMPESTSLLAQDTESAIAAGSLHAVAALVERVMMKADEGTGSIPCLMLTGNDAPRLKGVLNHDAIIEPELVMHGLALVAQSR